MSMNGSPMIDASAILILIVGGLRTMTGPAAASSCAGVSPSRPNGSWVRAAARLDKDLPGATIEGAVAIASVCLVVGLVP